MPIDLTKLNQAQRDAVVDTEGAVLVFAGAGSGKTRVLTHRVAYLVREKNIPSWSILAITFTNKAANEMRERLATMLDSEQNDVWVSTFHSLCARVLFVYADRIGYTKNFSILDETGASRMIKRLLREKHLDDREKDKIRSHISAAKNADLTPDQYLEKISENKDAKKICECYERYNELLAENNSMDFDDLQTRTLQLFKTCPDVLAKYAQRFRYIHVDEFQDTNNVQLELVKLLGSHWGNVFVVGDDDQSIYSWRGANVKNILDFHEIFPNVKMHKLMQNYRSTAAILKAANNVIQNNDSRRDKELFTEGDKGVRVEFQMAYNENSEAKWVIDNIRNLAFYNGYKPSDFAILTRVNALSRLYEMKLRDMGFDYVVLGGFRFFERQEILDVVAYMKMLCNPSDSDSIVRIINFPARGIGDTTVNKLIDYSKSSGKRLFDIIMDINTIDDSEITNAIRSKVAVFKELLDDLLMAKSSKNLTDFAEYLVEKVGFESVYTSSEKEEDATRWDNVREFLQYIKEFSDKKANCSLEEFLHTVTLDTDRQTDSAEKITIATMHSAKGLEFRCVFIVGCEEGIFPSERSIKEKGVEEERRVMYVAITRAKERLFISCAQRRNSYGSASKGPSRFFYEAKGEKPEIQVKEQVKDYDVDRREFRNIGYDEAMPQTRKRTAVEATRKVTVSMEPKKVYNETTDGFVKGSKVIHPRYGEGIIASVDGTGISKTAVIIFGALGTKKFALANAPLKLKKD